MTLWISRTTTKKSIKAFRSAKNRIAQFELEENSKYRAMDVKIIFWNMTQFSTLEMSSRI